MEFSNPTTKSQMYSVLNDIFSYYRIRRGTFEDLKLEQLELSRMSFSLPVPEQITQKAQTLIDAEIEQKKNKDKAQVKQRITSINSEINKLTILRDKVSGDAENLFLKSKTEVENKAFKNGLVSSGVVVDKISALEKEKNNKILSLTAEYDKKIASLQAESDALLLSLTEIDEFYLALREKEIAKKEVEINEEITKTEREVFKYNNALEEKLQRYSNTLIQANASLELKFLEINSGDFSQTQLIDMGYYEDVMRCVSAYYDTMTPTSAYQDMQKETKLTIYLDSYYQNFLYMYKIRAGY